MTKIITPAFIDLHTHLREPGYEYKEDIESASRAALAGGYGAVLAMPNTNPINDCGEVTKLIKKRGREVGLIDIYPVGAITQGQEGKRLADFKKMASEGAIALSDDGKGVEDKALMRRAMEEAKDLNLLIITHPEDMSAPNSRDAENRMIERDIDLAIKTGVRLHIAHISTKEGIQMVREGRRAGKITCEVTPHHLLLTKEDANDDPNFKMNPPLRDLEDKNALIEALLDGTIDAIATDHAPHSPEEKKDFKSSLNGVIGLETAFPVCLKLVLEKRLKIDRLIDLFTTGPARVSGIPIPNKKLEIDLDDEYVIEPDKFFSKSRNTPFKNWRVKGRIHVLE